jgi:hypothetical protein
MTAPVVLHLSNQHTCNPQEGYNRAFGRLNDDGLLVHVPIAPYALLRDRDTESAFRELRRIAREAAPDLIFVRSPQTFPWTAADVRKLLNDVGSPRVVFHEGDAWGGRKPVLKRTMAWLAHADAVFSVAVGEQATLLGQHTRSPVRYSPNMLSNQLVDEDTGPVPDIEQSTVEVAHVGNCYVRFGVFERVVGARDRLRLIRGLRSVPDCRVALYGRGWRGAAARGPVPFDRTTAALRHARITVGWDHYHHYTGYFSNRLPVSMYAGRVHVSSRPPGVGWLPGPEGGLHLVDTPREGIDRVRDLLRCDPRELHTAGLRARNWVRERLTNLHALLYMLGGDLALPAPPENPWRSIADLDPCGRATV